MPNVTGSYASTLTPLQLTAGQALLQNQGLRVNPSVPATIIAYTTIPAIGSCIDMLDTANGGTGNLSANVLASVNTLGSNSCPALSDSIPQYYINLGTFANVTYPFPGLSGIIQTKANLYLGSPTGYDTNWNINRFAQLFTATQTYAAMANQYIISACNANNYLCDTFTNTDNSTTGDITQVNLATGAFGQDLTNLGRLWDLSNLDNLGSPLALVQQIYNIVGIVPSIGIAFILAGVPDNVVLNLNNPTYNVTDAVQKSMYTAMTTIKGDDLAQILKILGVTTAGIETMADLLNPYKLFPTSFQSLTTVTNNGPRAIYTDSTGDVNTTLVQGLPSYVLSSAV